MRSAQAMGQRLVVPQGERGVRLRGSGSERDVEAEFEFGALPDPGFGFGARTKRHGFPSNLFHEDFPDA